MSGMMMTMAFGRNPAVQRGLSLVELMVALTLGIFLIWGVTQSFLTSRQSYRLQQGVGRIQENGRLAHEFLGFEIRNAGDYGCSSGDDFVMGDYSIRNDATCNATTTTAGVNMLTNTDFATTAFEYVVYGFNNDNGADPSVTDGANTIVLDRNPKANTDVLLIRETEELGALTADLGGALNAPYQSLATFNFPLHRALTTTLPANQAVAVSDCGSTKIFAVNAAAVNATNLTLSGANYCSTAKFRAGATVRRINTIYYFIAPSVNGNADSFSLFRQPGNGFAAEELLEGVYDMQLQFGIDTNSDNRIDLWQTADLVTAPMWNGWDFVGDTNLAVDTNGDGNPANDGVQEPNIVRAVRYSLLFMSDDALLGEAQTVNYNGAAFNVPGGRLAQVFTSSVGIRSRLNPD